MIGLEVDVSLVSYMKNIIRVSCLKSLSVHGRTSMRLSRRTRFNKAFRKGKIEGVGKLTIFR